MVKFSVIILAGGMGKRMKSNIPKVLHKVNNIPMIVLIINMANKLNPDEIIIVVGCYYNQIKNTIDNYVKLSNIKYAFQNDPLGTGHAVKCAIDSYSNNYHYIILNGDMPLLSCETLNYYFANYIKNKYDLQIGGIYLENPYGYGRIVLDHNNNIKAIIEEKECYGNEKNIKLCNIGVYAVNINFLNKYIPMIKKTNNEYYITDIIKLALSDNKLNNIGLHKLKNEQHIEISNINTKEQLDNINNLNIIEY